LGGEALFAFTVAVGLGTVTAISLSPLYARRLQLARRSSRIGLVVISVAILLGATSIASADQLLPARDGLFLSLFALLLLGTLLILGDDPGERGDDDERPGDGPGEGDPPWWPEFESGFSQYARRPRAPVATR
jgi:hypothetical protein